LPQPIGAETPGRSGSAFREVSKGPTLLAAQM
jgi:hypothetical protein